MLARRRYLPFREREPSIPEVSVGLVKPKPTTRRQRQRLSDVRRAPEKSRVWTWGLAREEAEREILLVPSASEAGDGGGQMIRGEREVMARLPQADREVSAAEGEVAHGEAEQRRLHPQRPRERLARPIERRREPLLLEQEVAVTEPMNG